MTSQKFDEIATKFFERYPGLRSNPKKNIVFGKNLVKRAKQLNISVKELMDWEQIARIVYGPPEPRKYSLFD